MAAMMLMLIISITQLFFKFIIISQLFLPKLLKATPLLAVFIDFFLYFIRPQKLTLGFVLHTSIQRQ